MSHHKDHPKDEPSEELEEKLEKHPHDKSLKVDVGSDESMDASDPPSATQPGGPGPDEPVPSSGAPKE
ncbi:hypothetical protein [Sphingomicrobium clamense]|uniref:Uncharacterized protein n=1 Tax=Sphingomicrobium clamense TaxID=2851013 RepID=A0ABS6V512_9SPHN|nr:hypothetical protein [Sphingomicrobium sp. B8]MBW0144640.1 hypothetical protein [Sphingomicrobium sp. B8]